MEEYIYDSEDLTFNSDPCKVYKTHYVFIGAGIVTLCTLISFLRKKKLRQMIQKGLIILEKEADPNNVWYLTMKQLAVPSNNSAASFLSLILQNPANATPPILTEEMVLKPFRKLINSRIVKLLCKQGGDQISILYAGQFLRVVGIHLSEYIDSILLKKKRLMEIHEATKVFYFGRFVNFISLTSTNETFVIAHNNVKGTAETFICQKVILANGGKQAIPRFLQDQVQMNSSKFMLSN